MAKAAHNRRGAKNRTSKWFVIGSTRRKPGVTYSLTPREREVLTLVAAGLSKEEIGRQLVISPLSISKLLVEKQGTKIIRRSGKGTVTEQRVYGSDGRLKTIYAVDTGSETFGNDLGYAFKKNVSKARRENKKKFGAADAIIQK